MAQAWFLLGIVRDNGAFFLKTFFNKGIMHNFVGRLFGEKKLV
jgi:hypothetical protein